MIVKITMKWEVDCLQCGFPIAIASVPFGTDQVGMLNREQLARIQTCGACHAAFVAEDAYWRPEHYYSYLEVR